MSKDKELKATHEGTLQLVNTELDVAVLNTGQRVISQSSVFKALGRPQRGNSRVIDTPVFMDAQNLQPFVDDELRGLIKRVSYIDKKGKEVEGYDANILPAVSDLYLKAREAGVISKPNQLATAKQAEILIRSLAKVAITALVDEATGYQYERERNELQKILKAYVAEELRAWIKTFPDVYYKEIFRLNGWNYTITDIKKRPGVVGRWTNMLIYKQLPAGVLDQLKKNTPKSTAGNYTARFFQSLTGDIGNPHLQQQLNSVITLMQVSENWKDFIAKFNKLVDRRNGQLELELADLEYKGEPAEPFKAENKFDQHLMGMLATGKPPKDDKKK